MKDIFLLIIIIVALYGTPAMASPPIPNKKITETPVWKNTPSKLKEEANHLSKQKSALEKKLHKLSKELQNQTKAIQYEENNLQTINTKVVNTQKLLKEQKASLKAQQQHIANLVTSLVKMNAVPLETLILAPVEQSEDLIISYHALQALHPELKKQVDKLEQQIVSLEQEKAELTKSKQQRHIVTSKLKDKKEEMTKLVNQRQKEHKKTEIAYERAQRQAQIASKTAKNLDELINTVKKKNLAISKKETTLKPKQPLTYTQSKTKRLPVTGAITTKYGQKDKIGALSKGIRIKTVPNAIVVSPKQGIIKYAGEFQKYGRIILVEHGKNYHSLIAGLDKIDTVVGQHVKEGVPIGITNTHKNNQHAVYYELRLNGKPVNPLTHLSRL